MELEFPQPKFKPGDIVPAWPLIPCTVFGMELKVKWEEEYNPETDETTDKVVSMEWYYQLVNKETRPGVKGWWFDNYGWVSEERLLKDMPLFEEKKREILDFVKAAGRPVSPAEYPGYKQKSAFRQFADVGLLVEAGDDLFTLPKQEVPVDAQ